MLCNVTRIGELGITLAITSNRSTLYSRHQPEQSLNFLRYYGLKELFVPTTFKMWRDTISKVQNKAYYIAFKS
jgi:hypothetical protein